jgi:predicted permease
VSRDRPPTPAGDTGAEPPGRFERLLRGALRSLGEAGESIAGDLREEHGELARGRGLRAAHHWYRRQALGIVLRVWRDRLRRTGPYYWMQEPAHRRGGRGGGSMLELWHDLRFAGRSLLRARQYAFAALLTLALAVAANIVVFSVVNTVLLEPLPYPASDRLVILRHAAPGLNYPRIGISPGIYHQYRENAAAFEESGLFRQEMVNLTGDAAAPDRAVALAATHTLFAALRVQPLLGRVFNAEEDAPDGPLTVLLSYDLWQSRFGGARDIVGRSIRVDGRERTVVGVMPAHFAFPRGDVQLWIPLALDLANSSPGTFAYNAVARLRPGMTAEAARVQLDGLVQRMSEFYPDAGEFQAFLNAGRFASALAPLKLDLVTDLRRPLWILLGTAAFVLIIACANVTNLFLVRAEARARDIAVRSALGAGRLRLTRHFLAETGVLAVAAGLVGLGLGAAGVSALLRAAPDNIPRLDELGVSAPVFLFTALVVVAVALLLAFLPAVRLTRPAVLALVSRSGFRTTAGRDRQRTRQLLVVVQTALALVLLAGSGLMLRTFAQLRNVNPGFDARDVLTFRLTLPQASYPDARAAAAFHERLLERLRVLPGIRAAGAISEAPLAFAASGTAFVIEDHPVAPGELPPMLWYTYVAEGYFDALRIPVLRGEVFSHSDREATRNAIVISAALAEQFWPGQDAVGKRIRAAGDSSRWNTVIGVVNSVRERELQAEPGAMVYFPMRALPSRADSAGAGYVARSMVYTVRAQRPEALLPAVRREVSALDNELPITSVATMEEIVANSIVQISFTMLALVIAATLALFLGAIGLYGVISYTVAQRTREIGVRMALGAEAASVRRMVVFQGIRLSALGLVAGAAAALGLTRLLGSLLYDTSPSDSLTFTAVIGLLASVSLLASWLPARRAARVDPARTLQAE